MTTTEMVNVYVAQLCNEIGCTPESIYSLRHNSWNFSRGSASVEVFKTSYETAVKTVRTFIRCFAPIAPLPADNVKKAQLFQEGLENSYATMGFKPAAIPGKGFLYAVAERDIDGMDYAEFNTLISDLGYWADQRGDVLASRFGNTVALN